MRSYSALQHIKRSVLYSVFCLLWVITIAYGAPVIDTTVFPAAGYHETLLHIDAPGRYSIQAQSPQGTRIEVVDRMAGPIFSAGAAGDQDGRIDALFDTGDYKLRLYSYQNGQGELTLAVYPFQEVLPIRQPEDIPILDNLTLKNGPLGDLQQQSFWIYLKDRQILRLEALGRNLKDARLWRDGEWLVEIEPEISTYEPVSGQPMTYVEFFHDLNPGLYRLTLYGGEPLAWAKESKENPLYVRMGIPELGANGQRILTISPFGREVFTIPGETNFVELSRKEKKDTVLGVGAWEAQGSRHNPEAEAVINKESRDPWCSLSAGISNPQIVSVQGAPGDNVVLKYFVIRTYYNFPEDAPRTFWIQQQATSEAADAIDTTAVLAPILPNSTRVRVEQAQVLEIGNNASLARKVNLLGEWFVFLKVLDDGTYVIEEDPTTGAKGEYKIESLLFTTPKDYTPPPYMLPGNDIPLTKGFFVLAVRPQSKGILAFRLRKKETLAEKEASAASFPNSSSVALNIPVASPEERLTRQRLLWPHVRLETSDRYVLISNNRPDVVSGFIVRPVPLDLSDPLPVPLLPGEDVPLDIAIRNASKIVVENDQEASFELFTTGKQSVRHFASQDIVTPGKYTLTLRNTSQQPALFLVKTIPADVPPPLTKESLRKRLEQQEAFPVLTEESPLYQNLERQEKQHFTLLVEEAGLYRLETSGRLATNLTVRNRFTTNLFSASQNGIGRNALVQQYLKPGEYQITVQTEGRSKGRAGIHLHRAPLVEETGLTTDIQKKIHLVPDEAVRYCFEIAQEGSYRLRTLGLDKTFLWRLEDQEGWPLVRPNQQGDLWYDFAPGSYYYTSLPDAVESRRITVLEHIAEEPPALEGKGPHPIRLNEKLEHVWREEEGHPADVFVLDLADPVNATISLSKDMETTLYQNGAEIALIRGEKPRSFEPLEIGRYEIHVKSVEESDLLPYTLRVDTNWLIPGLRYGVNSFPASFYVSVGQESLVDLFSFGTTDVKAFLWDGDQMLARSDDMENDWNFRISRKLPAGVYRLTIESVVKAEREEEEEYAYDDEEYDEEDEEEEYAAEETQAVYATEISMTKRNAVAVDELAFPFALETELSQEVLSIPFSTPAAEQVIRIGATGDGALKMALYKGDRMLTESEGEVVIPLAASAQYTLLLWRQDDAEGHIAVAADAVRIQEHALASEQMPLTLTLPADTPQDTWTAFKLAQADKISYRITNTGATLFFAPALETPFTAVTDVPVVMPDHSGWLLWSLNPPLTPPGRGNMVTITPFTLQAEGITMIELGQVPVPFDFDHATDAPMLLDIASVGALVGAMLTEQAHPDGETFNWQGMWMESSRTLIALPGSGAYRGKIWATGLEPVRGKVRMTTRAFPVGQQMEWRAGLKFEGAVSPGEAQKIMLSEGAQAVDVLLTEGLVAFVWQNGMTDAIAAAIKGNLQQRLTLSGGTVIVLNIGRQPGLYRLEKCEAAPQDVQPLDPAAGFEEVFPAPGKLVLRVVSDAPIFVAGEQISSRFLGDDGQIRTACEPTPTPSQEGNCTASVPLANSWRSYPQGSGLLEIVYEPGYVRVWQSAPEQAQHTFIARGMPSLPQPDEQNLESGAGILRDQDQLWAFTAAQPMYIIAETDAPGMTAIVSQDRVLATTAGSGNTGRQLEYFLPAGDYLVWTRPFKGWPQQGELRLHKLPLVALDDAAMAEIWLIRPGEIQVFRFEATAASKVGVGVKTESDQLTAKLFDHQSRLLADGPLMFQDLEPGEYIVTVTTSRPDAAPVQYRPLVFGHRGSLQGIPPEVVEQYQ